MSARCLRCGAGNEWIEGTATHRAAPAPDRALVEAERERIARHDLAAVRVDVRLCQREARGVMTGRLVMKVIVVPATPEPPG